MKFGFVLPCRSWEPIEVESVGRTAELAERLGFDDLWVTSNTLDDSFSFEAITVLSYAAARTTRIRLGVSVIVLTLHHPVHVAHQVATLDYLSGGRALLGVGLGRAPHYADFQVPLEHRVRRFTEGVELIKALWTRPQAKYHGRIFQVEGGMAIKPVQKPHPPLWFGGGYPDALGRAARMADGWMGAGGQSKADFQKAVPVLRQSLEEAGRNPASFTISKRVFMATHTNPEVAREEALRWFADVYHNPAMLETHGFYGTPSQAAEYVRELEAFGADHVLLNPIARYEEQALALADALHLTR